MVKEEFSLKRFGLGLGSTLGLGLGALGLAGPNPPQASIVDNPSKPMVHHVASPDVEEVDEPTEPTNATPTPEVKQQTILYTVKPGENLSAIAKKFLGSPTRWREIAKLNPRINPNKLGIGQMLVIPSVEQSKLSEKPTVKPEPKKPELKPEPAKEKPAFKVADKKLEGLKPGFRSKVENILVQLKAMGWQPRVAEGLRTVEQQKEKVLKGYSKTMNSAHLKGYGADIIDSRYGWSGPASDLNFAFWKDLGKLAKDQGLVWGGNWKFKDVGHVEETGWREKKTK